MKVLILSCNTGGGHNSCAKYVEKELKDNNVECEFKDFYEIVDNTSDDIVSKLYLSSLGNDGKIFKNVYKLGEMYSKTGITSPVYLINKIHMKSLYNYIINNKFDLVVTTHLFPSLTLTAINKSHRYSQRIKFLFECTDYEPSPFCEEVEPDYFIIQKGLEDRYISRGISKSKLLPIGITVASSFVKNSKSIRNQLSLKNEKVILIMLGSMGFGKIEDVINEILKIDNIKVMVVCGNNKKLEESLKLIDNDKLIVYGFVNNIPDLLRSCDIVMSKPGGLSSTEIATMGKPLLHIFPIPGIEDYNTAFFSSRGMSYVCHDNEEVIANVNKFLNNEPLCECIVENQHKYINENSGKDLYEFIIKNY